MNIRPLTAFMIDEHKFIMDEALFSFTNAACLQHSQLSQCYIIFSSDKPQAPHEFFLTHTFS
jgi:hypothetical protein